jgi:hypothetical protein
LGLTLTNPTLTTLKTTTLNIITGIAMDANGNYFVTSPTTGGQGVYLLDSGFVNQPIRIIDFPSGSQPQDVYYNALNDTLAVVSNTPDTVQFFTPILETAPDYAVILVGDTQTICVLQNDVFANSIPPVLQSVSTPNFGNVEITNNCIEYISTNTGRDSISYVVCVYAGSVPYCNTGTLYVTVLDSSGNHAPIAEDNRAEAVQLIPISVNVGIDDLDLDGDSLCIAELIGAPLSVIDSLDCNTIIYTADTFTFGNDTCYYVVCDNGSPIMCDTARLIVTVGPNTALRPVADFEIDSVRTTICGIFMVINTSVGDTGVGFWRIWPGYQSTGFTTYGDTAFYWRAYPWQFFGRVCLYVSNFWGSDTLCRNYPETGIVCVGLDDIGYNPIQLYPNPASDILFVELNEEVGEPEATLDIINVLGEKQKSLVGITPGKKHSIDVGDLPEGIYGVYINTGNNSAPLQKFIISR